jgi:hypothetical protein
MWDRAISTALSFDLELAKSLARKVQEKNTSTVFSVGYRPPRDGEHRSSAVSDSSSGDGLGFDDEQRPLTVVEHRELVRKLWLEIAAHVAAGKSDAKAALEIMEEANRGRLPSDHDGLLGLDDTDGLAVDGGRVEVLTIHDVLPLFPKMTLIKDFKEPLVAALTGSAQSVEELKEDMEVFTRNARATQEKINKLRARVRDVVPGQPCMLCGRSLLSREFYLFATSNGYHRDCLAAEVRRTMGPTSRASFDKLLTDIVECRGRVEAERLSNEAKRRAAIDSGADLDSFRESSVEAARMTELCEKLDDIVAAEDPLTGELMIESVGRPLEPFRLGPPNEWKSMARATHKTETAVDDGAAARLFSGRRKAKDAGTDLDVDQFFETLDWTV